MALAQKAAPQEAREHVDASVFSSPETFATYLWRVGSHQAEFTPEAKEAYQRLRDIGRKISLKQATPDEAAPFLATLAPYGGDAPQVTPVAETPKPEAGAPVAEAPKVTEEAVLPPLSFVSTGRGRGAIETPALVAEEAVVQSEVVPEPAPAPVVVSEPAPAAVPEVAAEAVDVTAISQKVEGINRTLNEFSKEHGGNASLVWLKKPETRYREYLTKLFATRDLIAAVQAGKNSPTEIAHAVEELQTLADAVRSAVSGTPSGTASHVSEQSTPQPEAPVPPQSAPQQSEQSSGWRRIGVKAETPAVAPTSVMAETLTPPPEPVLPVAPTEPDETEPNIVVSQKEMAPEAPLTPEVPETPEEQAGVPVENPKAFANVMSANEGAAAPVEQEESAVVPEQPIETTQAAPMPSNEMLGMPPEDPKYHSPEVEAALDKLLTDWLKGSGLFGLGKHGLQHPEWQKIAPVRVGDVTAQNGFVPPGLTDAFMKNLYENLRAWEKMYKVSLALYEDATVDEVMHRIVYESLNVPAQA